MTEEFLLPRRRTVDLERLSARVARRLVGGWWSAESLWMALFTENSPVTIQLIDLVLGQMDKQGQVMMTNRNGQLVYRLRNT